MTHSQQLSDIFIQEIEHIKTCLNNASPFCWNLPEVIKLLDSKIDKIQSLPQEPTTDELLEEMPTYTKIKIIKVSIDKYTAIYDDGIWILEHTGNFETPREALLALKNKLSSNQ